MTHETLSNVLARANGGDGPEVLLPFPLTATVVWATLWLEAPSPDTTDRRQEGDKVYLIRNGQQYVAIVHDLGALDLHWFVLPEHRGRQYLSTALRDVILPHLFQDGRASQRITISRNFGQHTFEASEKLARAVGFEHLPATEDDTPSVATLQYIPADLDALPFFVGLQPLPSAERLQQIRRQLAYHACSLQMLSEEMAMYLPGDTLPEDLVGLGIEVMNMAEKLASVKSLVQKLSKQLPNKAGTR